MKPFISKDVNWCWRTWVSGLEEYSPLGRSPRHMHLPLWQLIGNGDAMRYDWHSLPVPQMGGGGC